MHDRAAASRPFAGRSRGEQATLDRVEVVQYVEQHDGELGEGVECPGVAPSPSTPSGELETDRTTRPPHGRGQPRPPGRGRGGVEQPLDRSGDFGEPQVQTLAARRRRRAGSDCPAASSCAIPAPIPRRPLGVQPTPHRQELAERARVAQGGAVQHDRVLGAQAGRLGHQSSHRAEVVNTQALVHLANSARAVR